ncbi:MAG: type I glyceraldehyde-3-phosphate dehydrogenase [Candidatus Paceibacterota bacterium]
MKKIVAINGFGRIGRAFFRIAFGQKNIKISAINDLSEIKNIAYLLKRDTVYGLYEKKVEVIEKKEKIGKIESVGYLLVDGEKIPVFSEKEPKNLPWKELNIDVVIESTGVFEDYLKAKDHLMAGAKKVIISAPAKGEEKKDGRTILLSINDEEAKKFSVISNGSCTTNAVAPVIKILDEKLKIKKAVLNTIHAYTASQSLVDGFKKGDFLRGRAAAVNIVPSTTGASKTVSKVLENLENKFDGLAIRVPIICGSLADITFLSSKETSKEEVNEILKKASLEKRWRSLVEVSEEPLVSSDIIKKNAPAIVDLTFTRVVDKDLVKILVWYDNEWGYSFTLLEQILRNC